MVGVWVVKEDLLVIFITTKIMTKQKKGHDTNFPV
jgi:hypothetical protein